MTLKLGFALEGNSDYPIVPRMARRVIAALCPAPELSPDSTLRPRERGHGFVKKLPMFAQQMREDGVDIVVAVVDTDNTWIGERRQLLRDAKSKCKQSSAVCLADGLAVRKLEAWLLSDRKALLNVFGGGRGGKVDVPDNPEEDPDPKGTLNRIVRVLTDGREISFVPSAEKLADAICLDLLRKKCPHFDDFAKTLLDCVRERQRPL